MARYINAEMLRNCAYKRTKKGDQDPVVMGAIEKFEKTGETIVNEENIGEYSEEKTLTETVISRIQSLKENGTCSENNFCVP